MLRQIEENVNAYELCFDENALLELENTYRSAIAKSIRKRKNRYKVKKKNFQFYAAPFGDLLTWFSADDQATHDVFERFVNSIGLKEEIKQLVDYDHNVVMYCGFYIVSNRFTEAHWHVDYRKGANAYTVLTPLFPLQEDEGNLLYVSNDEVHTYRYQRGKAAIIGDGFTHTTEPYSQTATHRVLISLTLGTDKMCYWPTLNKTIGRQSDFLILPCGHQWHTCQCDTETTIEEKVYDY